MDLKNQVKSLRKAAGLTQQELARECGVGIRFLRELEGGKQTVRLDKVNQVLTFFNYHMEAVQDSLYEGYRYFYS